MISGDKPSESEFRSLSPSSAIRTAPARPLIQELWSNTTKTDTAALRPNIPDECDTEPLFHFSNRPNAKFAGFHSNDLQELLFKWGMTDHCYMKTFSYNRFLENYETEKFILDFFNDPDVNPNLPVLGTKDRWSTLGKVKSVTKEACKHTVTSLAFFDRLQTNGVLRSTSSQNINGLIPYHVDNFLIGDALRACLLDPAAESFNSFSADDRREFIFCLFKALCLGGRLCQYEDEIEPYLESVKKLYRDLVTVSKDSNGKLRVASTVFRVWDVGSSVSPLFPVHHPQNFLYLSIDPVKRLVTVFYHAYF
ncbi:hypothetical protein DFJ73DRAFT_232367 [Zopfochytrium polystomum]|nr:hypothetical protein DFJ73DRAFT_232367 [Zopfochytrium polystomum]